MTPRRVYMLLMGFQKERAFMLEMIGKILGVGSDDETETTDPKGKPVVNQGDYKKADHGKIDKLQGDAIRDLAFQRERIRKNQDG